MNAYEGAGARGGNAAITMTSRRTFVYLQVLRAIQRSCFHVGENSQ